jgi:hypothetical protein
MELPPVIGQIRFVRDENLLEGWCWSPEQPDQRQVVEIFLDDRFLVAMVAGWLDVRLQDSRIGDGRHGFALTLPSDDEPVTHVIIARARDSRHVFARIRTDAEVTFEPFAARINVLAKAIPAMVMLANEDQAADRDGNDQPDDIDPVRPWRELGHRLTARGRMRSLQPSSADSVLLSIMRRTLAEQCGAARLPACRRPRVSVILQAGAAEPTARAISHIAPAAAELQAEIVLVDSGCDPLTSLLPSLLRNLRCIFDRTAATPCGAGNLGAAEARGDLLIYLDCGSGQLSAAALIELATFVACQSRLVIGARLLAPLRRLGMAGIANATTILGGTVPLGLRLCVRRDLFTALGQFDTDLTDAPGLECADLFLKAMVMGASTDIWREPARAMPVGQPAQRTDTPVDRKRMLHALAAFRTRWQGMIHA